MAKTKMGRHKAKYLFLRGERISIDEELAPLIYNLWQLGIETDNCCQEHCSFRCDHKVGIREKYCYDNVWIVFSSCQDIEKFYNIVADYSDKNMYELVNELRWKKDPRDIWSTLYVPRNNGIQGHWRRPISSKTKKRSTRKFWTEDSCEKNDFVIQPQLTFPRKHLSYVEGRIALAVEKIKRKLSAKVME